jgi:hypothetical protein
MSDTPITDAEAYDYETGRRWLDGVVSAHIVRKLERENAELKEDNAMLRQMLDLALRIPGMSDSELKELIQNCKAVNDSKELIQNCKAVNDSARKEQP